MAFVVSIVTCAWALRATGLTEPFSVRPRSFFFAGSLTFFSSAHPLHDRNDPRCASGGGVKTKRQPHHPDLHVEHGDVAQCLTPPGGKGVLPSFRSPLLTTLLRWLETSFRRLLR